MVDVYIKRIDNNLINNTPLGKLKSYIHGMSEVSCIIVSNELIMEIVVQIAISDDMTMNDIKKTIANIYK